MMVTLYRREDDGSTRYVTITDRQGNLFGYRTLSVTSGNDFFLTREQHFTYANEAEMQQALRNMIDRRLKRGYSILYSYFGENQYPEIRSRVEPRTMPGGGRRQDSSAAARNGR